MASPRIVCVSQRSRKTPQMAAAADARTMRMPEAIDQRAKTLVSAMARPENPVTVTTMPDSDSITCVRNTSTESWRFTISYAASVSPRPKAESAPPPRARSAIPDK